MARDDRSILEHPSGKFANAREAIAEAIRRMRKQGSPARSAVFTGQGQGGRVDAYRSADVVVQGDTLDFGEPVPALLAIAGTLRLDASRLEHDAGGRVRVHDGTAEELARLLDAVYRSHFRIRPHEGEHDYAFGAEWSDPEPESAATKPAALIDLASRRRTRK
jgi:hypothetical protein